MGLSGKYDFKGIKEHGARAIELALSSAWKPFAAIMKIPVIGAFVDGALQLATNWLANEGLIVLNIGAIITEGVFDQDAFDEAMDRALEAAGTNREKLTDEQKKAIDDTVIKAMRKFIPLQS